MNVVMFGKVLVYSSKDKEDWEKAKTLLHQSSINFSSWESEEPPVGGCGSKVDVRSFMKKEPVPKGVFKIEVKREDAESAKPVLDGKVLPPRSYGVMV